MKTHDEVRAFLAEKFSREKKRLKSYSTKVNSFDLSNAITRYVQSLMSGSRTREIIRLEKFINKKRIKIDSKLQRYISERKRVTKQMSEALQHVAEDAEANRPWKRK